MLDSQYGRSRSHHRRHESTAMQMDLIHVHNQGLCLCDCEVEQETAWWIYFRAFLNSSGRLERSGSLQTQIHLFPANSSQPQHEHIGVNFSEERAQSRVFSQNKNPHLLRGQRGKVSSEQTCFIAAFLGVKIQPSLPASSSCNTELLLLHLSSSVC